MNILHLSDTHGLIPDLRFDADIVVHTGDLLPNRTRGVRGIEVPWQEHWIRDNVGRFKSQLGTRTFLYVPGNHDYVDPCPIFAEHGIDAVNIADRFYEAYGIGFYGFPWVPWFGGEWNYEVTEPPLGDLIQCLETGVVDVLAAHSPFHGVRDRNLPGTRCGSIPMRKVLQDCRHPPKWYLCGHIHESAGTHRWSRDINVSNAACTQHLVPYRGA